MTATIPSPAALQALIEIAQIANLLSDNSPCEEHEKHNWKELNNRLRLFRDDSFVSLKSEPHPSEHQNSVLASANKLLSYILSVRLENTPEWLNGLCEQINNYAEVTGETDRVQPYRDSIQIICAAQVELLQKLKPPSCRDAARHAFKEAGLTYDDLTTESLSRLRTHLNCAMELSALFKGTFRCHQRFKLHGDTFMLQCRAFYFPDREAVAFYKNGFIGFAGWASDDNAKVITDAFVAWVNEMKSTKQFCHE
jgi:hypothetical protein